jgi:hypothetical protein
MSLMNHTASTSEEYRIRQIHPVRHQHGAYCFYVLDLDGNCWEILANRVGGYSYAYDDPGRDITGPLGFKESPSWTAG